MGVTGIGVVGALATASPPRSIGTARSAVGPCRNCSAIASPLQRIGKVLSKRRFADLPGMRSIADYGVRGASFNHFLEIVSGKLVGQQIYQGHPSRLTEILWVRSGMNGARWRDEAHAIRRSDVPRAPELHERQRGVCGHDPRTGGGGAADCTDRVAGQGSLGTISGHLAAAV